MLARFKALRTNGTSSVSFCMSGFSRNEKRGNFPSIPDPQDMAKPNFYVMLASEPYYEGDRVVRCDCFLLEDNRKPTEPPALIQFTTAPRLIHGEVPSWKAGQVLRMEPSFLTWRDEVHHSGRCYLQLFIMLSRDDTDEFLAGLIPVNPDLDDLISGEPQRV
ncbi:MAG TPA: hypothetical protein VGI46_17425 [Candidatus Acidoferrum sp.]